MWLFVSKILFWYLSPTKTPLWRLVLFKWPKSRNDLDLRYSHTFFFTQIVCIYQFSGHRLLYFLKNPLFSLLPVENPKLPNYIFLEKVKVNPGSLFEQTVMGWSPKCYTPTLKEIGPTVPEKKIFEGFIPYMGVAAILVRWPALFPQNFISMFLKANIQYLIENGPAFFEKSFNFHM